ncbi:HipA domain-containing protein [soil metagenome]
MNKQQCLYCYQPLVDQPGDYHEKCSKKLFGMAVPPVLPFDETQIAELAKEVVRSQLALTGVQAKLSLDIVPKEGTATHKRFTIVGLWGQYILKPPSDYYQSLPELEDLTMHLAALSDVATVPHGLIRLGNSLAYITKRVDRVKGVKLPMEDMCQLTERLTEDKYRGSYEQIAKAILKHSQNPGLDVINLYEQVVFSYLTGNADMHLKNFSLIKANSTGHVLCPAYDMVATALVVPDDKEELALTLNARKNKIVRDDFVKAMERGGVSSKAIDNIFDKFSQYIKLWQPFIEKSFIPEKMKGQYWELVEKRARHIGVMV